MRPSLRIALALLIAFILLSIITISSTPNHLGSHLQDITSYRPSIHWSNPSSKQSHLLYEALQQDAHPPQPRPDSDDTYPRPPNNYEGFPPESPKKAVVMARLSSEDVTWTEELREWITYAYTVDSSLSALHTPRNKGREALAYLTYIVENYERLAETVAFIHSHKDGYPQAWHTDDSVYSNVNSLNNLQVPYVQEQGYVNLRCVTEVGCPAEIKPYRLQEKAKDKTKTSNTELTDSKDIVENAFLTTYPLFFPDLGDTPETIASPCCAQFAVSRDQIRSKPVRYYIRIREWLLDTDLGDAEAGRVMEYSWHIMFGREAVFCPDTETCWCRVYGYCFDDALGLGTLKGTGLT